MKLDLRFVLCPRHGWLPAYHRLKPVDYCPLCKELECPNARWWIEELGGTLAELAMIAVFDTHPDEIRDYLSTSPEEDELFEREFKKKIEEALYKLHKRMSQEGEGADDREDLGEDGKDRD